MADPVNFTRPAAERIARVVRAVEFGNRDANGMSMPRPWYSEPGSPLRLATFTGSWATGTWKTVTLTGSTQTASVYNWCNPSTGNDGDPCVTQPVVFGNANGTNSVVEIPFISTAVTCHISIGGLDLSTLPNYNGSSTQILGHDSGECLRWYSVTTCSTAAS